MRPRATVADVLAPALAYAVIIHLSAWSERLAEGGAGGADLVRRLAAVAFSLVYVTAVLAIAWRVTEWMRAALFVAPLGLALGIAMAQATLRPVWQLPASLLSGHVVACAFPILLVAPFSMIAAGVMRTVVDARLGRTTPPTLP